MSTREDRIPKQLSDRELYDRLRDQGATHEQAVQGVEGRRKSEKPSDTAKPRTSTREKIGGTVMAGANQMAGNWLDEVDATLRAPFSKKTRGELLEENRAMDRDFAEAEPGLNAGARLAGTVGQLFLPGVRETGVVKASALLGALNASGEAEGPLNKAIAGPVGAGAGATLGKIGEKVFSMGAPRALAAAGAAAGATKGDTGREHVTGAAMGAGAGYGAAKIGPAAARKILDQLRAKFGDDAAQRIFQRSFGQLSKALQREGTTADDILKLADEEVPGMTIMDVGSRGGPVHGMVGAASRVPSAGSKQIKETLESRADIAPSRAEKAVDRALGGGRSETKPAIKQAQEAISAKASPAYEALQGRTVSNPEVRKIIDSDPELKKAFDEGIALAKREFKHGMEGAEDLGDPSTWGDQIPVRAIDYWKRGLSALVEKRRGSKNPITKGDARILAKRIGDVVKLADEEVPEFATARATFAQARQGQKKGLIRQRETAEDVLGNSRTMDRAAQDADFAGIGLTLADLNPKNLLGRAANSQVANWLRGLDEQTVDALAPVLTRPLTPQSARDLVKMLEEFAAREETKRQGLLLPRAASSALGSAGGRVLGREDR